MVSRERRAVRRAGSGDGHEAGEEGLDGDGAVGDPSAADVEDERDDEEGHGLERRRVKTGGDPDASGPIGRT